jgi:hypothetical protein
MKGDRSADTQDQHHLALAIDDWMGLDQPSSFYIDAGSLPPFRCISKSKLSPVREVVPPCAPGLTTGRMFMRISVTHDVIERSCRAIVGRLLDAFSKEFETSPLALSR